MGALLAVLLAAATSPPATARPLTIAPVAVAPVAVDPAARVIKITAKKFEYSPALIELKLGVPVVLEFTSLDRKHGLKSTDLDIDAEIVPGEVTRVPLTPNKAGKFAFHCSVFCGGGHEDMEGQIVVTP